MLYPYQRIDPLVRCVQAVSFYYSFIAWIVSLLCGLHTQKKTLRSPSLILHTLHLESLRYLTVQSTKVVKLSSLLYPREFPSLSSSAVVDKLELHSDPFSPSTFHSSSTAGRVEPTNKLQKKKKCSREYPFF